MPCLVAWLEKPSERPTRLRLDIHAITHTHGHEDLNNVGFVAQFCYVM